MRIAILNWSARSVGGTGTYLNAVIPVLLQRGHEIAFWHEVEDPTDRSRIVLPSGTTSWSVERLGLSAALGGLEQWRPDVLYSHGLLDPAREAQALEIAPTVFLAHNYYGTCISGGKTFKHPTTTPCRRAFGASCLLQYYPRHCGGWNPVTMAREFRRQAERIEILSRYRAIVTLSTHMQREYERHGLQATRIFEVRREVLPNVDLTADAPSPTRHQDSAWRVLFVGRMDELKGGNYLLEALPTVVRALDDEVWVTFAGDGPQRARWQERAAELSKSEPKLRAVFTGWVPQETIETLFAEMDLLVVPSVWPEPFGMVGLEAARHRLPVAAFAVGGIPEWLHSGVNGFLADANPPTPEGLADAIVRCLQDRKTHTRLRQGAGQVSPHLVYSQHVEALMRVFQQVVRAA